MPANATPPEFCKLTGLSKLDLSGNCLTNLPQEIGDLTSLTNLYLRHNPWPLPPEILEVVNDPWSITEYYLKQLSAD